MGVAAVKKSATAAHIRARAPGPGGSRCLVGCTAARNAPRTCGRKSDCLALALALKSIDHGRVLGAWLLGFTNKAQPVRESALWRARHEILYEILLTCKVDSEWME